MAIALPCRCGNLISVVESISGERSCHRCGKVARLTFPTTPLAVEESYYFDNSVIFGPLDYDSLLRLGVYGRLLPEGFYYKATFERWVPLAESEYDKFYHKYPFDNFRLTEGWDLYRLWFYFCNYRRFIIEYLFSSYESDTQVIEISKLAPPDILPASYFAQPEAIAFSELQGYVNYALSKDWMSMLLLPILSGDRKKQISDENLFKLAQPVSQILFASHDETRNVTYFKRKDLFKLLKGFKVDIKSHGFLGAENSLWDMNGLRLCFYVSMMSKGGLLRDGFHNSLTTEGGILPDQHQKRYMLLRDYYKRILKLLVFTVAGDGWDANIESEWSHWKEAYSFYLATIESNAIEKKGTASTISLPPSPESIPLITSRKETLLKDALAARGGLNTKQFHEQAIAELNGLVGLSAAKAEINRLIDYLNIQAERRKHNLKSVSQTLHFVFLGNPGTGKTTVARIISKLLFGFGFLKTTKFIECGRSDLVGGYLGQTAIKTDEKIQEALDGVLFIDEAYSLFEKQDDMYGREAISTLLKRMEDYRDRLSVIVAGYPRLMDNFLKSNPGLRSRFTRFVNFDDYSAQDMVLIFNKFCNDAQYTPDSGCNHAVSSLFSLAYQERDETFGNARYVRNVFEEVVTRHSQRLMSSSTGSIDRAELARLDARDVPLEEALIEVGKRRGFLSVGVVHAALPDDCTEPQIKELLDLFDHNGIEVVSEEEATLRIQTAIEISERISERNDK